MKLNKSPKILFKKVFIMSLLVYATYVIIGQQKTLNSYKKNQQYYQEQINEQLAYQKDLNDTKTSVNSQEYIEKEARERLDMFLPNERVYIDSTN